MKTYEMTFPLTHPHYVIADLEYERKRNRILAFNHPIVKAYRKCESLILNIKAGNMQRIYSKFSTIRKRIAGEYKEK